MTLQPQEDDTISQAHDMAASSTASESIIKTATIDDARRTNKPAGPKPIVWQHNYFATWLVINLISLLIIAGLAAGSLTISAEGQGVIGGIAFFVFLISLTGTLIMAGEVWSRTAHTRMLGGIMGFGLTASYALMGQGWSNGWHRTVVALSGWHVGFLLESITGVFGMLLQGLANIGEPEDPAVIAARRAELLQGLPNVSDSKNPAAIAAKKDEKKTQGDKPKDT